MPRSLSLYSSVRRINQLYFNEVSANIVAGRTFEGLRRDKMFVQTIENSKACVFHGYGVILRRISAACDCWVGERRHRPVSVFAVVSVAKGSRSPAARKALG